MLLLPKGIHHPLLNCDLQGQLLWLDTLLITQFTLGLKGILDLFFGVQVGVPEPSELLNCF